MFLDADDLLLPTCIERSVQLLEQNLDIDVVYSDCYLVDGDANRLGVFSEIYPVDRPVGRILGELGYRWSVINISSTLVRRSAMEGIQFDTSLTRSGADDFEYWRRLAACSAFGYVDEVLACYRCHDAQMSSTRIQEALEGAIEVQRRIIEMPEFAEVAPQIKARVLCHHGARNAMIGRFDAAEQMFRRAIRTLPRHPAGYALLALSFLGDEILRFVLLKRRQLTSGRLNKMIAG
jgi:hypothetical protein